MGVLNVEKPKWMTEDLEIFQDAVTKFFERECVPHNEDWIAEGKVSKEAWRKAGEAGILCASMPEEYGGGGGSFAHEAIIYEAQGRLGVDGFGISLHNGIAVPYILHYGSEEQKRDLIPRCASGELITAIAMTEPGTGSDLQSVRTSARRDGDEYVINGQKTFITNGQNANLLIVVAKTNPEEGAKGISLFLVETEKVDGFKRGRNLKKMGQKSQDTSELFFDEVRVPAENLLGGEEGRGFFQLMEQLPQERHIIGIQGMASIERALELTVDYVKERKAFGKPLIAFQNTQFKLAEVKTKATVTKVFVDHCTELLLDGKLDSFMASMSKLHVSEVQNEIIDECLQLFGGYGFMDEYPISRLYTDARVQRIYGGTSEVMKLLISRSL
jgi:acyl-CoA dehydrogenase